MLTLKIKPQKKIFVVELLEKFSYLNFHIFIILSAMQIKFQFRNIVL